MCSLLEKRSMLWLDLQGFVMHSSRGYEGPFSTLLRGPIKRTSAGRSNARRMAKPAIRLFEQAFRLMDLMMICPCV